MEKQKKNKQKKNTDENKYTRSKCNKMVVLFLVLSISRQGGQYSLKSRF